MLYRKKVYCIRVDGLWQQRELWLTLKEKLWIVWCAGGLCSLSVLPCFSLTCYINRMLVGDEAGPWCQRKDRDAAAVCWLLEDSASPSHLLITVVPETQLANNCPATAVSWILHWARADGSRESTSLLRSQPEQIGAQLGLSWPSGLICKPWLIYINTHALFL